MSQTSPSALPLKKRGRGRPFGSKSRNHLDTVKKETISDSNGLYDTCPKCNRTYFSSTIRKHGSICYKCVKRARCARCQDGKQIEELQSKIVSLKAERKNTKTQLSQLSQQVSQLGSKFDNEWHLLFERSMSLLSTLDPAVLLTLPSLQYLPDIQPQESEFVDIVN